MNQKKIPATSWETDAEWYASCVGKEGHYYHQTLILPNSLRLLNIAHQKSLLDLGCGNAFLAGHLPSSVEYYGVDASPSLIKKGKAKHLFVADVTQPLPFPKRDFTCATFILSLQNMEHPERALATASSHLLSGGHLLLVLNHPCFRIPRQSSWEIDESHKLQYRRINRYLSPLKVPIQNSFSFHHSLSALMSFLREAHFAIVNLEEWCSTKKSTGSKAKMEDRARSEIPLFLAILARKE